MIRITSNGDHRTRGLRPEETRENLAAMLDDKPGARAEGSGEVTRGSNPCWINSSSCREKLSGYDRYRVHTEKSVAAMSPPVPGAGVWCVIHYRHLILAKKFLDVGAY